MQLQRKTSRDFVFHIERVFDASQEKMWELWTDVEKFASWFGPKGCTIEILNYNFCEGGEVFYRIELDGNIMFGKWLYKELVPNETITGVIVFTDESGANIIPHALMPGWPLKILSEVHFSDIDGKTKVSVDWSAYEASDNECEAFEDGAPSCQEGWTGTFEVLQEVIKSA